MPNTNNMLQKASTVPSGANQGKINIVDDPELDTFVRRNQGVLNTTASQINTDSGNLDVTAVKQINITMDANITVLNLTGLDDVKAADVAETPLDADTWPTIINFIQSGVGNFTVALGTSFTFSNLFSSIVLSGSVGKRDKFGVSYAKSINKYEAVDFVKGFN